MKAIILAAGKGERMESETENKPKCLIKYKGKAIIDYTLETLNECGINDIIIVNGYKNKIIEKYLERSNVGFITNNNFNSTNMVYSLFCAESKMDDDLIVTYSDIIYNKQILNGLINNESEFAVTVDKKWADLWKIRMDNPLSDAETMKLDPDNYILELGKKPSTYKEIQGQYIGLFKMSYAVVKKVKAFYHSLDKSAQFDGNNYNNMYMTTFIQLIIDKLLPAKAEIIEGGWLEFDTKMDLHNYNSYKKSSRGL